MPVHQWDEPALSPPKPRSRPSTDAHRSRGTSPLTRYVKDAWAFAEARSATMNSMNGSSPIASRPRATLRSRSPENRAMAARMTATRPKTVRASMVSDPCARDLSAASRLASAASGAIGEDQRQGTDGAQDWTFAHLGWREPGAGPARARHLLVEHQGRAHLLDQAYGRGASLPAEARRIASTTSPWPSNHSLAFRSSSWTSSGCSWPKRCFSTSAKSWWHRYQPQ